MTQPNPGPFHLRSLQNFAINQERQRSEQALYQFGEYAMFCLMWNRFDYDAGLVGLCLRCTVGRGLIAEVYQQAAEANCPDCFGTRYEGGFKALLVRPAIWDVNEEVDAGEPRGLALMMSGTVQTTGDFRIWKGDFVFRADGSRWQVKNLTTSHIQTGFGFEGAQDVAGYNFGGIIREDETTACYLIPPLGPDCVALLSVPVTHYPRDFSATEVHRTSVLNGY